LGSRFSAHLLTKDVRFMQRLSDESTHDTKTAAVHLTISIRPALKAAFRGVAEDQEKLPPDRLRGIHRAGASKEL